MQQCLHVMAHPVSRLCRLGGALVLTPLLGAIPARAPDADAAAIVKAAIDYWRDTFGGN